VIVHSHRIHLSRYADYVDPISDDPGYDQPMFSGVEVEEGSGMLAEDVRSEQVLDEVE
jgi:hypothetical protein